MDRSYSGRASDRQARRIPQAGSPRPLLAAMTRLRGSPATLQEISALGGRARPRAPLPLTWQDRAGLGGLRQYEIWLAFGSPPRPNTKIGHRGSPDRPRIRWK